MEKKYGVNAIVFDDMGEKYFLILHRILNWDGWEFVKGGIEQGEEEEDAVIREVAEETGITNGAIIGKLNFNRCFKTDAGNDIELSVYLVKANMNTPINVSKKEHDNYLWATEKRVMEKLTHQDEKEMFSKALEVLRNVS